MPSSVEPGDLETGAPRPAKPELVGSSSWPISAPRGTWAGVFLLSLGLLLFELCLTRVLSVLFYYHTAFLAISVAMLGLAAGGIWVHLRPGFFLGRERRLALLTAISMCALPLLFPVIHLRLAQLDRLFAGPFLFAFGITALASLLPFLGGGIVLASIFRRFPRQVPKLYAADLVGAAGGTLLLVPVMGYLGGPGALFACGVVIAAAALFLGAGRRWLPGAAMAGLALLAGLQTSMDLFPIQVDVEAKTATGSAQELFKKWNAFSRVVALRQRGWQRGLSARREKELRGKLPEQIEALIDINAYAPLVRFDGNRRKVAYLADLVANVAHYLQPPGARVAILGPGGGKDVLSALLFEPTRVVGIEINPILVNDLVRGRFRKFTGDIYGHPRVEILVGDGRAQLRRLDERFDLIVANSVITWAAHSAGALNLAEHSLFTTRACGIYLDHLRTRGILSVSLWDENQHTIPLRWLATCGRAARERGQAPLAERAAVLGNPTEKGTWFSTILIRTEPFTQSQKEMLRWLARKKGFDALYIPGDRRRNAKELTAYFADPKGYTERSRYDIGAVTDDRPFFLYTLRWRDALRFWDVNTRSENVAYFSLMVSLLLVLLLVAAAIFLPLWRSRHRHQTRERLRGRELWYFSALGAGFMLVEIPLIQRLTIFLGHPTYALTVVLCALLVFGGIGSRLAGRWAHTPQAPRRLGRALAILLVALAVLWVLVTTVLHHVDHLPTALRILIVLALLAPVGLLMGMPMPAGLVGLGDRAGAIPWAWGVGGATGVLASVAAILVAVQLGFTVAFAMGGACYLVAWLSRPAR